MQSTSFTLRLPQSLLEEIDLAAKANGHSRSREIITRLGHDTQPRGRPKPAQTKTQPANAKTERTSTTPGSDPNQPTNLKAMFEQDDRTSEVFAKAKLAISRPDHNTSTCRIYRCGLCAAIKAR